MKSMEEYPKVFGKDLDLRSKYGALCVLERELRDVFATTPILINQIKKL